MTWFETPTSDDFIAAAVDAARWIRSTARETEHGLIWLPDPNQPERDATITAPATIYSGNAGIVLFLLELADATGDSSYLDEARRGADQIAATWREVLDFPFMIPLDHVNLDFNHGLSGTAFTLAQVWRATGDTSYRDAALEITRHIADVATAHDGAAFWTGAPSAALGDGAIVLYLLWAAREFDDPSLLDLARRSGEHTLALAEPEARGGLKWTGFPMETLGMSPDAYMPNFEFGTAGVAYVLSRLAEETGDERFLRAAAEGARHVTPLPRSVATRRCSTKASPTIRTSSTSATATARLARRASSTTWPGRPEILSTRIGQSDSPGESPAAACLSGKRRGYGTSSASAAATPASSTSSSASGQGAAKRDTWRSLGGWRSKHSAGRPTSTATAPAGTRRGRGSSQTR